MPTEEKMIQTERPDANSTGSFAIKIGSVMFYVSVRPSENAKETLETKLRKAITKEAMSPSFG